MNTMRFSYLKTGTRKRMSRQPARYPGSVRKLLDLQPEYDDGLPYDKAFTSHISNPRIIGPGLWASIHTMAAMISTPKDEDSFIAYITHLCGSFPCGHCADHCKEYIRMHPLKLCKGSLVEVEGGKMRMIGLFNWSWAFHNAVNVRLGKQTVSWRAAVDFYFHLFPKDEEFCDAECGKAGDAT